MRFTPVLVVVVERGGVGGSVQKEVWVEVSLKYPENRAMPCSVPHTLSGQIRECPGGLPSKEKTEELRETASEHGRKPT